MAYRFVRIVSAGGRWLYRMNSDFGYALLIFGISAAFLELDGRIEFKGFNDGQKTFFESIRSASYAMITTYSS